eukprot:gene4533-5649_t
MNKKRSNSDIDKDSTTLTNNNNNNDNNQTTIIDNDSDNENNNNINIDNDDDKNHLELPEEKKTEKRLVSVENEEEEDEEDEKEIKDLEPPKDEIIDSDSVGSTAASTTCHHHHHHHGLTSSSSSLPTSLNLSHSSVPTTGNGSHHQQQTSTPLSPTHSSSSVGSTSAMNTSPTLLSTSNSSLQHHHHHGAVPPSPKGVEMHTISDNSSSGSLETYHDGRKVISADSGSSDVSGGEEPSSSCRHRKKKKKIMRPEGKIYELLEARLGSEALRNSMSLSTAQLTVLDWPYELVLVRHGQSEGNEAQSRSKRGDLSAYTPEFKRKHSSTYRLTDKGILQAKIAGKWVKENIAEIFDRYYTSEYVRAMETASLLELPNSKWLTEIQLRERDKGKMDNISWTEKNANFGHEMELRKRDSFFWAPPGGESIAQICVRVEHTFNTLRRECANKRVIIVAHGEIMWAFRVRLERLSQIRFHQLQSSKDPRDQIHNTSILWYTRVHPKTGEIFPYFKFLRMVCPWKPEYSAPGWLEFDRPVYSNEELMESVRTVPRFVNNADDKESPSQPKIY